uniref:G_PROTEIN_RECEP_F1_2 domain-containing protein n=1 Tax=Caenorhabditis tropicalis TaxID=1561998 RepID=A0A1I7TJ10_9PELO
MSIALYRVLNHHMIQRRRIGLRIGEKQHYGGPVFTIGSTIIFLILDMCFNLFCDIYEITLHYSNSTNADFFFFLKNCRTVMRTMYCFLAPYQLLALCSLNPHFQSTMVRYLNGTDKIEVRTLRTIGGDTITKVMYEPLPEPSKMKFLARMYYKWCRCYFAMRLFGKFLDFVEESARNRRQRTRQRRINREIDLEAKANANKPKETGPGKAESVIQIDPVENEENEERISLVSSYSIQIVETTV